jgi:probable HAF family extracellular repeat protein
MLVSELTCRQLLSWRIVGVALAVMAVTMGAAEGAASYTFTQLDAPFANVGNSVGETFANAINNGGKVVGYTVFNASTNHGFVYNPSTQLYTQIDVNLAGALPDSTFAYGINDNGDIVGSFIDNTTFTPHAFLYTGGTFTQLDAPFANVGNSVGTTTAYGINNQGQIVGTVLDGANANHGFIYSAGVYTQIDNPAAASGSTFVTGINNLGQIVGYYQDSNQFLRHGFLATPPASASVPTLSGWAKIALVGLLLGTALTRRHIWEQRPSSRLREQPAASG